MKILPICSPAPWKTLLRGDRTNLQLDTKMPVAGKTGTTTSYNDLWFVGYTPYYTCGISSGYDTNEKLPDEGIFRNYHQILLAENHVQDFLQ